MENWCFSIDFVDWGRFKQRFTCFGISWLNKVKGVQSDWLIEDFKIKEIP